CPDLVSPRPPRARRNDACSRRGVCPLQGKLAWRPLAAEIRANQPTRQRFPAYTRTRKLSPKKGRKEGIGRTRPGKTAPDLLGGPLGVPLPPALPQIIFAEN